MFRLAPVGGPRDVALAVVEDERLFALQVRQVPRGEGRAVLVPSDRAGPDE